VTLALVAALTAFAAGLTGAWSPCGFSMVDTLGEAGRGRRAVLAACAAFTVGAVAGGVVTFGALAALGAALQLGGSALALGVAVAVAGLAAAGEAAGVRVVPQIRRQVPERWRRVMPLPAAAALYGLLLGLGFTTFVLTLAVWALAGVSIALGSPLVGVAIGVGFGAGRALPVVVMAPRLRGLGGRMLTSMMERPQILRRLRLADAAMLAGLAVAIGAGRSAVHLHVEAGVGRRARRVGGPDHELGPRGVGGVEREPDGERVGHRRRVGGDGGRPRAGADVAGELDAIVALVDAL